ncbi:flagellar hook-associated protein FlgK [Pseudodesulfovibrio sp.]|uniref:flagellar hook-associated protein FlgK n=1 Tax=Pseudodesulfovibrio sp. TaxID=2035812 RepID=UPI00260932A2|nr:flagellar hook-associated protein FlgK [Pseudodesulfovibrio sp.]MDD3312322.1 flagellar hook-associated protein FlgK [Pseudodesulfovibrio sp.]
MSFGANSILDMGRWAMFASQVQLQVTGENISNVNTEGYSRRSVVLEEGISIDYNPGQMGTGVVAKEVIRHFDDLVETLYLEQASLSEKWGTLYEQLRGVENLLNESSGYGVSASLSNYFESWNKVSQYPDDYGARKTVVDNSNTMISVLSQLDASMATMQQQINDTVRGQVGDVNTLLEQISDINNQIQIHNIKGQDNTNSLFDERARKVRALGELIDITTLDNGGGDFIVMTKAGQNLVDGANHFSLEFTIDGKTRDLAGSTNFAGDIYYEGSDDFEYTIEFVASSTGSTSAGTVTSGTSAARFRVSLDGGRTWLSDENGDDKLFYARDYDSRVTVEGLGIWFGSGTESKGVATGDFQAGDRFILSPHPSVYWVQNTSNKENITPQIAMNGEENTKRLTGGSIAALLSFRDSYVGKYRDKLESFTESLIWETNRRHSQGAGLQTFTSLQGAYSVNDKDKALASDSTGLAFGDRLQSGSSMVYVYNANTGLLASSAALNFGGGATFDPNVHTLQDVCDAYNTTFAGAINASVVNNKLVLQAASGYNFAFGTDTSGLNAALGVNTFFTGSGADDIGLNDKITGDLDYLAVGHVNGAGEMNSGDNTTALSLYALRDDEVTISSASEGTGRTTLLDYYNSLVGNVGTDTSTAKFNMNYYSTLASDLNDRQQEVSGVNLDEEMTDLIKYQASYTAAAKLISTADEMLQTILSLKS